MLASFGTVGLNVTPSTPFTVVPGLSQTVNVPANTVVVLSSDGAAQVQSSVATGFGVVDIVLTIDGNAAPNGGFRRLVIANSTGITNMQETWSMSLATTVAPGSHTFAVETRGVGGAASNVTVSGDSNSVLQGQLTVSVINQ